MENQRTERKLAAILAADVVGYSRLMSHDEEGTLRRLKAHLGELVEPHIAAHRGRIVKRTGDGLLVDLLPYKNPADFQRIVDGLAKAGLP